MNFTTISKFLLLTFLMVGCSSGLFGTKDGDGDHENRPPRIDPTDPIGQTNPLQLTPTMSTFPNCEEAETYIENEMVKRMTRAIDNQLIYIARMGDDRAANGGTPPMEEDNSASDISPAAAENSASGPENHTTTNNQVVGVEEADLIKNDGKHIYHLAAGKLNILKSWPANEMAQISSYSYKGRMTEMLLEEDKLVLIGVPEYAELPAKYIPEWMSQNDLMARPRTAWDFTKVIVVDISDLTAPTTMDTYLIKGQLSASRQIDKSIRMVLNGYGNYPEGVQEWVDWNDVFDLSNKDLKAKYEKIKLANEIIIRSQSLAFWLDSESMENGDVRSTVVDTETCQNIHAPTVDTEYGITKVVTLNLDEQKLQQTILFSHVSHVYASKTSLYLTSAHWWWNDMSQNTDFTYLHKFDLTSSDYATYLGSGGVQGTPLNQFSMDEHNDVLRIATTIRQRLPANDDTDFWDEWKMFNRVSTFQMQGDQLIKLGQTEDLAPDERIYSARFYGDRGFVVTFRQVDPLFTLDLSDPSAPTVVGELKIPGFSNYMQLIDENHILAIGSSATLEGRVNGMKLSIFDVTDMAAPAEIHNHVLSGDFWSDAQYDHKAFTYFPSRQTLAIPVAGYIQSNGSNWYDRYFSNLTLFDVNPETGISPKGTVHMNDIYLEKERDWGWWSSAAQVNRSIFADDYVYAVSNLGIRATTIEAPETPIATVRYECNDDCFSNWWW
jgi:uncharacterized secreted protein with C-terminal beta-propeller domain